MKDRKERDSKRFEDMTFVYELNKTDDDRNKLDYQNRTTFRRKKSYKQELIDEIKQNR